MTKVDIQIRKARLKLARKKKTEQSNLINSKIGGVDKKANIAIVVSKEAKNVAEKAVVVSSQALDIAKTTSKLKGDTGEKGTDGKDGKDGEDGKDGRDGKRGVDGKDGEDGRRGLRGFKGLKGETVKGKNGKDGEDGSPDTKYEIRDKLSELKGGERLDAKHIKNINKQIDFIVSTKSGSGGSQEETDPIYEADKPDIVFNYNNSLALEYTDEMVSKITSTLNGDVTVKDFVYTYTGDDLTKLSKTVDSVTYEKDFTWTNGQLTNISVWVEV